MSRYPSWRRLTVALLLSVLASAEVSAQRRIGLYRRTILVNPVPGNPVESGSRLLTAMSRVASPSSTDPWLVKLEPGIYDIEDAQLVMMPFADVEGSGEGVTLITGVPAAQGTVVGAADSELRDLTVEHRGGVSVATAIFNEGDRFSMRHVTGRAADGTTNTSGIHNRGDQVEMVSVTGRATASESPTGVVNNGRDGKWSDLRAFATGDDYVYGFFNYGDGLFVDVLAEAEAAVGFAGAIRNEGGAAPVLRGVKASARGEGIGQGITNGGGSNAEIHDAVVHASGDDFAVGVSNQYGDTRLFGVQATAEGGSSAYGIADLYGGTHRLTEVTAVGVSDGFGVGLLTDFAVTSLVNRSTLQGKYRSVEQRADPGSTTLIGASQLIGPAGAGSGVLKCVGAYGETFDALDAACLP